MFRNINQNEKTRMYVCVEMCAVWLCATGVAGEGWGWGVLRSPGAPALAAATFVGLERLAQSLNGC